MLSRMATIGAFALLSLASGWGQLSTIYSFSGADGAWARGSLTISGDTLFGRTSLGGDNNTGTIFSITPDGLAPVSALDWSYSFAISLDPDSASVTNGGDMPHHNAMNLVGTTLYGTALYGGNNDNPRSDSSPSLDAPTAPTYPKTGNGTIFSIQTDGTGYSVLHTFSGTGSTTYDAATPHSPFYLYNGLAYGMTSNGGANNQGAVYALDPAAPSSSYQVLYSFAKATGDEPHGVLTVDSTGHSLLGMTRKGGPDGNDGGVIFRYNLTTPEDGYEILHTFTGGPTDGATNDHGFLTRIGQTLYGVTEFGGLYDQGVVFTMQEDGSDFSLLHSFGGTLEGGLPDGATPFGSLVEVNGILYGTTTKGGAGDVGIIFSLNPETMAYAILASFDLETTGGLPEDFLTPNADGTILYGLTQTGGIYDPNGENFYGTLFAIAIPEPASAGLLLLAALLVLGRAKIPHSQKNGSHHLTGRESYRASRSAGSR